MSRILKPVIILMSLLLIGVAVYVRLDRPFIAVRHQNAAVVIDVQTLGEYPTTISRIRLVEVSSGKVVFEVIRKTGTPQLTSFSLSAGDNSIDIIDPKYWDYKVATPSTGKTFALRPKDDYELAMWGTGWLPYRVKFRVAP
jgi:hypothetical protein